MHDGRAGMFVLSTSVRRRTMGVSCVACCLVCWRSASAHSVGCVSVWVEFRSSNTCSDFVGKALVRAVFLVGAVLADMN